MNRGMEQGKPTIIKSIKDGDMRNFTLSKENVKVWRQRIYEINRLEGWKHYQISINRPNDTLTIISNIR